jgi:hypothetical protein
MPAILPQLPKRHIFMAIGRGCASASSAAVCFTNRAKRFTAAQPLPCYLALRAMACSADTNGEQFASGVKFMQTRESLDDISVL